LEESVAMMSPMTFACFCASPVGAASSAANLFVASFTLLRASVIGSVEAFALLGVEAAAFGTTATCAPISLGSKSPASGVLVSADALRGREGSLFEVRQSSAGRPTTAGSLLWETARMCSVDRALPALSGLAGSPGGVRSASGTVSGARFGGTDWLLDMLGPWSDSVGSAYQSVTRRTQRFHPRPLADTRR
jgi:hypothetical protein